MKQLIAKFIFVMIAIIGTLIFIVMIAQLIYNTPILALVWGLFILICIVIYWAATTLDI